MILVVTLRHWGSQVGRKGGKEMEYTEEELERMLEEIKEFVGSLSKEMDGKQVGEVLPFDIAMITVCVLLGCS